MLDRVYTDPRCIERARHSWLREVIDHFLNHLAAQRYKQGTLCLYARQLLPFAEFTAQQGLGDVNQLPQWVEPFIAQLPPRLTAPGRWRLLIGRFIDHLQRHRIIPAPTPPPPSAQDLLVADYLQFLREQRGLCDGTLGERRRLCRTLSAYLAREGVSDFHTLRADAVHRFIVWRGRRCSRRSMRNDCSMLRDFLAFLHRRGVLATNLAAVVMTPRLYRHEQCPRFLTRSEIEAVLAAIDRTTPRGRRDYAMILLLAVYGLRGGEVVRLRLDDIDWREQLLYIRQRKAGNSTTYPLSVAVGEAVVAYLRQGRPAGAHREVFLSSLAPYAPLGANNALAFRVKQYMVQAGVRVARPGTHSFRYSCAQRLFEQGVPLKSIGDYLGHQHPATTQGYTALDLQQLREVAAGDGEDLL